MQTREELIQTLEQADTPSIRLFTLLKLKELSPDDPLVLQQQVLLAEQEPVCSILKEQHPEGYWVWERSHYTPKYKATHWSMQLLTELGLSGDHPAMQQGAAYMRKRMQQSLHEQIENDER